MSITTEAFRPLRAFASLSVTLFALMRVSLAKLWVGGSEHSVGAILYQPHGNRFGVGAPVVDHPPSGVSEGSESRWVMETRIETRPPWCTTRERANRYGAP